MKGLKYKIIAQLLKWNLRGIHDIPGFIHPDNQDERDELQILVYNLLHVPHKCHKTLR